MPDLGRILDLQDRADALDLVDEQRDPTDSPGWPLVADDDTILEVDHSALFPTGRPTDTGQADFEVFGDSWTISEDVVEEVLRGAGSFPGEAAAPEWDVWAWYQPIHFFGPAWGIYVSEVGLIKCAQRIAHCLPPNVVSTYRRDSLAKAVIRVAFNALFLHEQYHHKTESAGLRLHVIEQRCVYIDYFKNVYWAARGTADQIEEGLANADSWHRLSETAYTRWTGRTVMESCREYLWRSFPNALPGYANAAHLIDRASFDAEQQMLFARLQEGATPVRKALEDFGIATHLNHSLFSVTQNIFTIVRTGKPRVLPTRTVIAPAATARVERVIAKRGWKEIPGAGKGSHRKFRNSEGRMIILPSKKEVSYRVMRTTAETLGVRPQELERLARET